MYIMYYYMYIIYIAYIQHINFKCVSEWLKPENPEIKHF